MVCAVLMLSATGAVDDDRVEDAAAPRRVKHRFLSFADSTDEDDILHDLHLPDDRIEKSGSVAAVDVVPTDAERTTSTVHSAVLDATDNVLVVWTMLDDDRMKKPLIHIVELSKGCFSDHSHFRLP